MFFNIRITYKYVQNRNKIQSYRTMIILRNYTMEVEHKYWLKYIAFIFVIDRKCGKQIIEAYLIRSNYTQNAKANIS